MVQLVRPGVHERVAVSCMALLGSLRSGGKERLNESGLQPHTRTGFWGAGENPEHTLLRAEHTLEPTCGYRLST